MFPRHLAQLNIALMREPADAPGMADFFASIDRINAVAESAPGFVWRLQGDPPVNPFGANALVPESMVNPTKYFRNNVGGGLNLADAARAKARPGGRYGAPVDQPPRRQNR